MKQIEVDVVSESSVVTISIETVVVAQILQNGVFIGRGNFLCCKISPIGRKFHINKKELPEKI